MSRPTIGPSSDTSWSRGLAPPIVADIPLGFSFSWGRVSRIFVGYRVAAILGGVGQIGVFVMIGFAMLLIVATMAFSAHPPTAGG